MNAESIFRFLDQRAEEVMLAKYNGEEDWAAGYQSALLQLRNFISSAADDIKAAGTTVDLLN
jgi:hypothetical protein